MLNRVNKIDFACQSSGNCCKSFDVNLTHLDIERILNNLPDINTNYFVDFSLEDDDKDVEAFISTYGKSNLVLKKKKNSQECVFLKDNQCSIHSFKPLVCRVWPFSWENNEITWIKEHNKFIKKTCKYKLIKESNNKNDLIKVIKLHYKERKIFAKLVSKWNSEQEKSKNENFFREIINQDFLDYILYEIEIRKAVEIENNQDENTLEKIITSIIQTDVVNLVLEDPSDYLNISSSFPFLCFTVYLNETISEFIAPFIKFSDINNYNYDGFQQYLKFIIQEKVCIIFFKLNEKVDSIKHNTKIIYNPNNYSFRIKDKKENISIEIQENYQSFVLNIIELINFFEYENLYYSEVKANELISTNLYKLIYSINQKVFRFNEIIFLKNKTDDLKHFFTNYSNYDKCKSGQIKFVLNIIDLFKRNLSLYDNSFDFSVVNQLTIKLKLLNENK